MVAKSSAAADLGDSTQPASLTPVIWAVVIASFGAFAFGYHCGVVNGPLNAIAADLGFAGNAALQGTVSPIALRRPLHAPLNSHVLHNVLCLSVNQHRQHCCLLAALDSEQALVDWQSQDMLLSCGESIDSRHCSDRWSAVYWREQPWDPWPAAGLQTPWAARQRCFWMLSLCW